MEFKKQLKWLWNSLKQWIVIWIWISFVLWLIWITYASVSSWDTLTATMWNEKTVPTGAVMSFYLSSCPEWWVLADGSNWTVDLRWTVVRWIWWDLNWRDVERTLWEYQEDSYESHSHTWSATTYGNTFEHLLWSTNWNNNKYGYISWWYWAEVGNFTINNSWWSETRSKNVALLFCIKD